MSEQRPGERTPHDGMPYYCDACGAGWAEFIACEQLSCRLETIDTALARAALKKAKE